MKLIANRPGSSSLDKIAIRYMNSQDPEYQKWLQEAESSGVMKRFVDMTQKMLGGGFMKNRPPQDVERMRQFIAKLDPKSFAAPGRLNEVGGQLSLFEGDLNAVRDSWIKTINTIDRQKDALAKYFEMWNQVKTQIEQVKAVMLKSGRDAALPIGQAAPRTSTPQTSTQAPATPVQAPTTPEALTPIRR